MDNDAVADQTDLAVLALQLAVQHVAARHRAHAGHLVGLAHLGVAQQHLAEFGGQHALHGGLDLIDGIVDDAVHPHVHVGAGGAVAGGGIGTDVKAHDDGLGRGGQHHVGLVDGAHAAVDDADADLVVAQLLQGGLHGLHAALHVGLDDEVQVLHLAGLDLTEQILQRHLGDRRVGLGLLLGLALLHQLAGQLLVGHGVERSAGGRGLAEAGDLHGHAGARLGDALALVVDHGTDAAHGGARDDNVALMQGAVLDQQGGHGAAALVQTGLDDGALCGAVGVGLQLAHLGGKSQHLQQVVDAHAGLGGDGADDGVAAPLLAHQTVLGELLLDALGVGLGLIHLVDGHDDGDTGGLGVVDGLHGLGHDTVLGGHHQNGDIRYHGAAGAHGGKGLVAGGVQERDGLAVDLHLICADVLGDAARLAGGHMGVADIVQQTGLAVVHVTHDHHHRRPGHQILVLVLVVVDEALLNGDHHFLLHLAAHLLGDDGGGVEVDHLAQRGHNAVLHQALDHLCAGFLHAAGQLAHADLVRDLHLDGGFLGDLQLELSHLLSLVLTALVGEHLAALTVLVIAEFLLAALLGHPLAPLAAQLFQTLVILGQVHVAALAGIHQLFLRHTGGGLSGGCGFVQPLGLLGRGLLRRLLGRLLLRLLDGTLLRRLRGFLLLCCRSGLLLGLLGRALLHRLGRLLLRLLRCRLCGLRRLLGRSGLRLGRLRLLRLIRIDGGNAGDLIVLGQMLKNDGQLMILQRLHIALGRGGVFVQNFGNHLGGETKVPRHISYSVFFQSKHLVHLQPGGWAFRR